MNHSWQSTVKDDVLQANLARCHLKYPASMLLMRYSSDHLPRVLRCLHTERVKAYNMNHSWQSTLKTMCYRPIWPDVIWNTQSPCFWCDILQTTFLEFFDVYIMCLTVDSYHLFEIAKNVCLILIHTNKVVDEKTWQYHITLRVSNAYPCCISLWIGNLAWTTP